MKRKIIGIFMCIMLMTTFLSVATSKENIFIEKPVYNDPKISSFEDDVPIWKKGEKWIYNLDDIEFGDITSGLLHLQIRDLSFTVLGDSGVSYNLETKAYIGGFFEVDSGYYIKGDFINTKMDGVTYFRKTDLGIEEIDLTITGRLGLTIQSPDLPFSIPRIPFRFTIDINLDFDSPFSLLDFPLEIDKTWGLAATNCTITGEIRSLLFNIISFMDKILHFIPVEYADLLPVIDLKEVLDMLIGSNIFSISEMPDVFNCIAKEMKTVSAGTYEAYHVNIGDMAGIYYAPEIGNILEISAGDFRMELKKYTTEIKTRFV